MDDRAPILRPAARVLLVDQQERVLLLRANVGEGAVWITPGGALEPGETAEDAARRELRQETVIEFCRAEPCVWTRAHRFEGATSTVPDVNDTEALAEHSSAAV